MRGPYRIQPERYAGRGDYEPDGLAFTVADQREAAAAVRRIAAESGIVPRVTDAGGHSVGHLLAELA